MDSSNQPNIYITGFGPFGNHLVNASQKVVERLQSSDLEAKLGAKLHTQILDVAYDCVLSNVVGKWKSLDPKLVIHIGVSELANDIVLEKQAFNKVYEKLDVKRQCPQSPECVKDFPATIQTRLDLNMAIKEAEIRCTPVKCSLSFDPGRYLCGFAYYLSLSQDNRRCLFIHVPPLQQVSPSDPESAVQRLVSTICVIVENLYRQITEAERESGENLII